MKLFNFDIHIGKYRVLVQTRDIADKAVTPSKLSDRIVPEVIEPILEPLKRKDKDLQNQIDSLQIHGLAVSNEFGDDPHISISQKKITSFADWVTRKLEEITGEVLQGFNMVVTPEYFTSDEGCILHVTADASGFSGTFKEIEFFINDEKTWPEEGHESEGIDVGHVEFDREITETSTVRCRAVIDGREYEREKTISHYAAVWLGAGAVYTDIMKPGNMVQFPDDGGQVKQDIAVANGQHIIIVMAKSVSSTFLRADINGIEIPFVESTSADGNYKVFVSEETFQAGKYDIHING